MTVVAKLENVSKIIKGTILIDNVDLEVHEGEILALIGENGAGKTSLMKLLFMFLTPTTGKIELFGQNIVNNSKSYKLYNKMESIIETPLFDEEMTAKQVLEFHCKYMSYQDDKAIEKTLNLLGIYQDSDRKIKEFSLGMKQKLALCKSFVTNPSLLILDEPLNGIDSKSTNKILNVLKELSINQKTTIVISSHVLKDLDKIADRAYILSRGRIVKEIDLKILERRKYLEIVTNEVKRVQRILESEMKKKDIQILDDRLKIYYYESDELIIDELMRKLMDEKISINSISKNEMSLEEYVDV
ncbi:MAG: ABC transporter ATP-binding protein [Lactobacillales bacterium]|jgi:ABC-2 type transport system ATP-binding protein|nr:ABC transporter ATP-binding protein [Lactobacillales bacterium]